MGKSSLINGLVGKNVVSTSSTPGKTKHFQTILLSEDIELIDCPGLVFPALDKPKPLQILLGLYPIAQVREPYTAIRYLAERIPIEEVYNLNKWRDIQRRQRQEKIEKLKREQRIVIGSEKEEREKEQAEIESLEDKSRGTKSKKKEKKGSLSETTQKQEAGRHSNDSFGEDNKSLGAEEPWTPLAILEAFALQ